MERYFGYLTRKADQDEHIAQEIVAFNPLDWLSSRDFDKKKKDDYLATMVEEWRTSRVKHGCYETMVKSGEVYYAPELVDGDYMPGDDRPRNIMIGSK